MDEISVLQTGGLQDGGKLAAKCISTHNVIVGRATLAAVVDVKYIGISSAGVDAYSIAFFEG